MGVPLFDYSCPRCSESFEELVRSAETPVVCPACGAEGAERRITAFAGMGSGGAGPSPDYSRLQHHRHSSGCGHRH